MEVAVRSSVDLYSPTTYFNYNQNESLPTAFYVPTFSLDKALLDIFNYTISFKLRISLETNVEMSKGLESYRFANNSFEFQSYDIVKQNLVYAKNEEFFVQLSVEVTKVGSVSNVVYNDLKLFKAYDYLDTMTFNSQQVPINKSIYARLGYSLLDSTDTVNNIGAIFELKAMGKNVDLKYEITNLQHDFPPNCLAIVTNPVIAPYVVVSAP